MDHEERFEQSWLDEMNAVENFRRRYYAENRMALLDRDDPDVRRLLEALCFSAVRTRQVTLRNLWSTWRRLLGGYFEFLLRPLPAMAVAQAMPTARMTEAAVLPKGSELRLTTQDGFSGVFTTMSDLRVMPMTLDRCEMLSLGQGQRLLLTFVSRFPRTDPVGMLRLYVHYLDDYLAALQVHDSLRRNFVSAVVFYDSDAVIGDAAALYGTPTPVSFGSYFDEPYEADAENPLERVRNFFHFPEQELFINIKVPPPRRPWSRLAVCIDLGPEYRNDPPLNRQIFCPFAVPVHNLRRLESQPIECNGTKDSYPIRYTHADRTFVLQQVRGCYSMTQKGLVPLPGAVWSEAEPSFEVEDWAHKGDSGQSLLMRLPPGINQPLKVVTDAMWYQPEFADHASGPMHVSIPDRSLLGLEWQITGPLRRHLVSPLCKSADQLLHLLSLKMKPILERDELLSLLDMFGSISTGPYQPIVGRVRDLAVEVMPDATLRGNSLCHVYHAQMLPSATAEWPLVWQFLGQMRLLLDAWDYEARVELAAHVGDNALPRPLPKPELVLR